MTGGLINFLAGGLGTGTITVNGAGLQWRAGQHVRHLRATSRPSDRRRHLRHQRQQCQLRHDARGGGDLTKAGGGTLTLGGRQPYTGATNVNGGTLRHGAANVFASSSAVTVASGATLDLQRLEPDPRLARRCRLGERWATGPA